MGRHTMPRMLTTNLSLMPLDRVTEREGTWILRQGPLNVETYVSVYSELAPAGTLGRDLKVGMLAFIDDDPDFDGPTFPAEVLRELLVWPPDSPASSDKQETS